MGIQRRQSAASRPALVAGAALVAAATLGIGTTTTAFAAPQPAHPAAIHHGAVSKLAAEAAGGPEIKLLAAQRELEAPKFGKGEVFFDPGIWLASLRSALQINVSRASYSKPEKATEVIRTAAGIVYRPLPSWVMAHWNGLRHFLQVTVRNSRGHVVGHSDLTFCPDIGFGLAKATPNSASTDPYPQQCSSFDPFPISEVWGLSRGWAADSVGFVGYHLGLGTFKLTATIRPAYQHLFHIARHNATATMKVKVVSSKQCCGPDGCCFEATKVAALPAGFSRVQKQRGPAARHGAPSLPATKILKTVPKDALPDLIPLPSWGISVSNAKKTKTSFLDFGATVWIGGNSPLDVEGFRIIGTNKMRAYQYFYKDGTKLIGRMRVGSMGFSEYNAWHFNQFAQYLLLNKHRKVVVRSRKVGFCIAPTDNIDMLARHATWVPTFTGLSGNCGDPSALWTTEILPIGWGDTYIQTVPFQSFDVTKIPNGTYYIEIIVNPEHLLHETNRANDISLRKVIISGTAGHRTVRVPAFHGIDPENGKGGGFFF